MADYAGLCRKLIEALQELMPQQFSDLHYDHFKVENPEEWFRLIISQFAEKIVAESHHLAYEYAIVCEQISEIFEPIIVTGDPVRLVNPFKYNFTNQLQLYVKNR